MEVIFICWAGGVLYGIIFNLPSLGIAYNRYQKEMRKKVVFAGYKHFSLLIFLTMLSLKKMSIPPGFPDWIAPALAFLFSLLITFFWLYRFRKRYFQESIQTL